MKLTLAIGNSRKEKQWKNCEVTWTEFLDRVKSTYRTVETVAEYRQLAKAKQDELKDVGGFVGGRLKEGIRKTGCVEHRSMLTLDMDYAEAEVWDFIVLLYDYACCLYSTHKHTPEAPRFRLVIPLARTVTADEYQAVARKVAEEIGIEQFDDTTYAASRLMYWPSTSSDGEYVFKSQAGQWLDPDRVLAGYNDWQDTSSWAVSSRHQQITKQTAEKQADPTAKEGIVGSFCRAYSLEAAIHTFLADRYTPSDLPDRYTYIGGSTFGGLVIYDGSYAYSYHATDPVSGRLCNAFDLVRLHKFGVLDKAADEADEGTPMSKRPYYMAMQELAIKDGAVKRQLAEDRLATVAEAFKSERSWAEYLHYKKDGTLAATIENLRLILENDPQLSKTVGYNEFAHRNVLLRDLYWRGRDKGVYWSDADDAALRHYLERVYGLNHVGKTMDALSVIMEENRHNPVKAYLESLVWDGIKRLDTLLVDYLGADDNAYTRAVTRKALAAAAARIFDPGCKFDYMLLLVGAQGLGKSYLINRLGGQWFSDSLTTVIGKEAYEQLQGAWIVEMGELSAARKADIEALKHFISKQEDIFREAYGRRTVTYPRQCIFIGTTNDNECLRDRTGNRRFWPVNVSGGKRSLWQDLNVDQIWAEAVLAYRAGEELYLKDLLADRATEAQAEHTEESDKAGLVYDYLETLLPEDWNLRDLGSRRLFLSGDLTSGGGTVKRSKVCALEVWCECLGGDTKQLSNSQAREIRGILDNTEGWERHDGKLHFGFYGRQRAYRRI